MASLMTLLSLMMATGMVAGLGYGNDKGGGGSRR